MNPATPKRALVIVLLAIVLVLGGIGIRHYLLQQKALRDLPVNTKMGGDFVLPSTLGHPLRLSDLKGKVVLLNFGFTSCPDVCPLVLARLRQVIKGLEGDAAATQVVFVSFDPARDTLPNLKAYVTHFHPDIIGATGTDADIAVVAARYGVVYLKENSDSAAGYNFTHSDYIYLLDREGRLRKLYASDAPVAEIVQDVRLLQAADGAGI